MFSVLVVVAVSLCLSSSLQRSLSELNAIWLLIGFEAQSEVGTFPVQRTVTFVATESKEIRVDNTAVEIKNNERISRHLTCVGFLYA